MSTAEIIKRDDARSPGETLLSDCSASFEGDRFVVRDSQRREAYSEHGGGHVRTAWNFLTRERIESKWKTVHLLACLRQAFREDSANCNTDELDRLLDDGPSASRVSSYLASARARDFIHHGGNTF